MKIQNVLFLNSTFQNFFYQPYTLPKINKKSYYSIYENQIGDIWIGAANSGVYRYDGEIFTLFRNTDRMDLTWSMSVQSILEDSNGTLWFGFSGGLFRLNESAIINVTQEGPWN